MKLIEMLVDEGLNGWQWPDGTIAITQDKDKAINQYATADGLETNEKGTWKYSASWQTYLRLSHEELCLASDWDTAIITREQYEAALAAKNDGWIEWGGGKIPVDNVTVVDIKFRSGVITSGVESGVYYWQRTGHESDIIAYRLHKQQEAAQPEADDQADLNECIEHDAAPVWNGAGMPPVGCFCEITDQDGMLVYGQGESGEVIAHVENTAVIRMSYGLGCFEAGFLRPLRTEAERKRDKARKAIYAAMDIVDGDIADAIYDAIAAGEIPGVKLEDL